MWVILNHSVCYKRLNVHASEVIRPVLSVFQSTEESFFFLWFLGTRSELSVAVFRDIVVKSWPPSFRASWTSAWRRALQSRASPPRRRRQRRRRLLIPTSSARAHLGPRYGPVLRSFILWPKTRGKKKHLKTVTRITVVTQAQCLTWILCVKIRLRPETHSWSSVHDYELEWR